jgi:histidinol-phosphatase (PHP family)
MDFAKRLFGCNHFSYSNDQQKDVHGQNIYTDNVVPQYIIGSLHVLRSGVNISLSIDEPLSQKDIKEYYDETLEMVELGGFDTLGHLGIYKRGISSGVFPDESHVESIIDEIFRVMIKNNICLEVNNSAFNSHFHNFLPDPKTLMRYKKLGGQLVTISSDSHYLEQFDRFYMKTLDKLQDIGFTCFHEIQHEFFINLLNRSAR